MAKELKEISIEIIRKCPNNCLHCSSSSDEHRTETMEYDCFKSVVCDAKELGAETICLSGGEPFLHNRIIDMVNFVSSLKLQTHIYTSGIIFDEKHQRIPLDRDLLKAIPKERADVIFNIEAAKSSTYDKIMGTTGCFDKLKQSIKCSCDLSINTEAHFVPMKLNISETEDVISLCKEFNISVLSFLRLVPQGRASLNESEIALSNEELVRYKAELVRYKAEQDKQKKQSRFDIRIGHPLLANSFCQECNVAKGEKLNIRYDGRVFPCEVFKNNHISYDLCGTHPESIYEKSLIGIYNNSAYLQQVQKLSREFSSHDGCGETCIGQYLISNQFDSYGK